MASKKKAVFIGVLIVLLAAYVLPIRITVPGIHLPIRSETSEGATGATGAVIPTPIDAQGIWASYKNKTFAICLKYPGRWFGPEVYEYKDGFLFEVGNDRVYRYGTPLEHRVYTRVDDYYIAVTFTRKPSDVSVDQDKQNQPWLEQYLPLLTMKDGESKTDQITKLTKIRTVKIGDYSGVEYISTPSETARTDFYYRREVFLIDSRYNTFQITGSPANVRVANEANRRNDYKRVEGAYLSTFRKFVDSISLCDP